MVNAEIERLGKRRKRIMIVEDHAMTRLGIEGLIAGEPDLEPCGTATTVSAALREIETIQPDLVLVDLSLKDGNGLDLIEQIRRQYPDVKTLVMSMHNESLFADRALQAGAMGYVCKAADIDEVLGAIRRVLKGKISLSEEMSERILCRKLPMQSSEERSFTDILSNRELEVFQMIGRGQTRRAIASNLHLSVKTIETHQEKIKKKLNLKSSQEVVCRAVQWLLENETAVGSPAAQPVAAEESSQM